MTAIYCMNVKRHLSPHTIAQNILSHTTCTCHHS